jgi:hypothetical protein
MRYVNARKVFTPKLVKQIQKYYYGGYLWKPKQNFKEQRAKICDIYACREFIRNTAEDLKLTERIIPQIIHGKEN